MLELDRIELTSEVPAWDRLLLLRTEVPAGVCRRRVTGRMMVSLYERPASDRVSALQLTIINNHPHKWRQWWTLFWKDTDLNSNECLKRMSLELKFHSFDVEKKYYFGFWKLKPTTRVRQSFCQMVFPWTSLQKAVTAAAAYHSFSLDSRMRWQMFERGPRKPTLGLNGLFYLLKPPSSVLCLQWKALFEKNLNENIFIQK